MIKVIYRHNPRGHKQYGNEIILFHSDERYKKRIWRFNIIEDLKNLKPSNTKVFGAFTIENCDAAKSQILLAPKIGDFRANKGKIRDKLELKVVVGEFSEDTQEIIKHAANNKFELITIIGGPKVFCEDRTEIYTLLDRYENIEYFILPTRPNKHFMIFNKRHLYIEKPHRHNESRGSVGVKNSNLELTNIYNQAFIKILRYAKPLTKEEVLNHKCYKG